MQSGHLGPWLKLLTGLGQRIAAEGRRPGQRTALEHRSSAQSWTDFLFIVTISHKNLVWAKISLRPSPHVNAHAGESARLGP
jgi:hypothetical protein